jgi:mono/diheme cytochrome c family protein
MSVLTWKCFVTAVVTTIALGNLFIRPAGAADGGSMLKSQCAQCHALAKPEKPTLQRLWERKGPDLWYAGVKFQKKWLVAWLQNPVRIRPAGVFYFKHVKPSEKEDSIDPASLTEHPKLSKEDSEAVATALMALERPAGLVDKDVFKGQKVPVAMGAMFFGKLRGCAACHSIKPGDGGDSGPELGSAGERLQADFILSYIKDPQKFDPKIWMPKQELSEQDLQRLTGYLVQMQKGGIK